MTRALFLVALFTAFPAIAQDDAKTADEWKRCVMENVGVTPSFQTDLTTLTQQAFAACKADENSYRGSRPLATREADTILMREQIAAEVAGEFSTPADNGIAPVKKDDEW